MIPEINPKSNHKLSDTIFNAFCEFYRTIKPIHKSQVPMAKKYAILQKLENKYKLRANTLIKIYIG